MAQINVGGQVSKTSCGESVWWWTNSVCLPGVKTLTACQHSLDICYRDWHNHVPPGSAYCTAVLVIVSQTLQQTGKKLGCVLYIGLQETIKFQTRGVHYTRGRIATYDWQLWLLIFDRCGAATDPCCLLEAQTGRGRLQRGRVRRLWRQWVWSLPVYLWTWTRPPAAAQTDVTYCNVKTAALCVRSVASAFLDQSQTSLLHQFAYINHGRSLAYITLTDCGWHKRTVYIL